MLSAIPGASLPRARAQQIPTATCRRYISSDDDDDAASERRRSGSKSSYSSSAASLSLDSSICSESDSDSEESDDGLGEQTPAVPQHLSFIMRQRAKALAARGCRWAPTTDEESPRSGTRHFHVAVETTEWKVQGLYELLEEVLLTRQSQRLPPINNCCTAGEASEPRATRCDLLQLQSQRAVASTTATQEGLPGLGTGEQL